MSACRCGVFLPFSFKKERKEKYKCLNVHLRLDHCLIHRRALVGFLFTFILGGGGEKKGLETDEQRNAL